MLKLPAWFALVLGLALLAPSEPLGAQDAVPNGTEPRIRIEASDQDLDIVIESIAKQAGYNVVLPGDEIQKKVTVRLDNVGFEQALRAVVEGNGFFYRIKDNIILVYTPEMAQALKENEKFALEHETFQSRVFHLQHVPYVAIESALRPVISPAGTMVAVPASIAKGWAAGVGLILPSSTTVSTGSPAGSSSTTTAQPTTFQNLLDVSRSYTFVVNDVPSSLENVARVVTELDVPRKQVYISVVIFEMAVNEQEQLGFRWRISNLANASALPWNFPFGHSDLGDFSPRVSPNDPFAPSNPNDMFPDVPASSNALGDVDAPFLFGSINLTGTEVLFEMNRLGAETNFLSNPHLMVGNHEEALILVGERFPILESNVTDQGTTTESFTRYEPIGVQMQVIPHVLDNGEVELSLNPQVSALGNLVVGTTGLTAPRINTRSVQTRLKVKNGQSVVIAGLVSERTSENVSRTPFLSAIPILGALFRYRSETKEKVDLVMVVTPYVDAQSRDFRNEMENSGIGRLRAGTREPVPVPPAGEAPPAPTEETPPAQPVDATPPAAAPVEETPPTTAPPDEELSPDEEAK